MELDKNTAIRIRCQGADSFPIDSLTEFQGNLKNLSVENYAKLKKQILEIGFSEPISVWVHDGKIHVLNGHQRLRVLKGLRDEGFFIPKIPVSLIQAESMKDAKQKVLALTSQFGEITDDGLYEFMNESGLDLNVLDDLRFPEINLDIWRDGFAADGTGNFPELSNDDKSKFQQMTFLLHDEQAVNVEKAIGLVKGLGIENHLNSNSNGNAIEKICLFFLEHNGQS